MNIFRKKFLVAILFLFFSSILFFARSPRIVQAQTFAFLFWGNKKKPAIKITPTAPSKKPSAPTVGWDKQHRILTGLSATTPLVSEMTPNSPGKEIAYVDADRKLFVYGADGTPLATSSATVTSQTSQTSEYAPSAIDLYGDRDTQGNTEYDILLPSTISSSEFLMRAFKVDYVDGQYRLVATSSASVANVGQANYAAAVDDLDHDGKPEVIAVTKKSGSTSLLAWTFDPSTKTFVPLNNGVDSGPVILTVSTNSPDGFLAPAIGNISLQPDSDHKQVAVAVQTSTNALQIYVFSKNANSLTLAPVTAQTAAPYYWLQEQIDEIPGGATGVDKIRIGGISLADLSGDARLEVVATTKKHRTGTISITGYLAARAYQHDTTSGAGVRMAGGKIEMEFGGMDVQPSDNSSVSRPTIGKFEGKDKAIAFKSMASSSTTGGNQSLGLFAAYYTGSALAWIPNYQPRMSNARVYDQGGQIVCSIKSQSAYSMITLADTDNNGKNELIYQKEDLVADTLNAYHINLYNAEGPASLFDTCAGTPVSFDDVNSFTSITPSVAGYRISSASNLEIADVDGNNTIEAIISYNILSSAVNGLSLVPFTPTLSVLPTEWPMTGASACRQGRMGATCPSTSFTPLTPTPTSIVSSTPTPAPSASCDELKYYIMTGDPTNPVSWVLIPDTSILPGDTIYVTCTHTVNNGTVDKARFRVNASSWTETTNKKPGSQEYYFIYVFPTGGAVTNFKFEAEVHLLENNQWY